MSKPIKLIITAVVTLALMVTVGTFVFIHFAESKPAAKLTLDTPTVSTSTTTSAGSSTTTATGSATTAGTWNATDASQVGYRVSETLFGQSTEAVGRTNQVTGTLVTDGTTVSSVNLSVDMTTVKSDQNQRDNQFNGRIMDTSTYPTATFKLTKPITLPTALSATPIDVDATGDLTLRGTTKNVTVDLKVELSGNQVKVNGDIPITFADWNIPNPTFGPAQTGNSGTLELLVVFEK